MTYNIEVYEKSKGSRKLAYSEKVENGLDVILKLFDFVEKNDFERGECYLFEKLYNGGLMIRYCDFRTLKNHINTPTKKTELGCAMISLDIRPSFLETIILSKEQLDMLKKL